MITPRNVVNHELIGLTVEVVKSRNADQKGLQGRVVDETLSTLKLEIKDAEKTVAKAGSVFRFTLPSGERVRVDGNVIAARSEDRIKKSLEKW